MKNLLALLGMLLVVGLGSGAVHGQNTDPVTTTRKLKVIFQLASDDPAVHTALLRQLSNFRKAAPNARMEVVCHNNGIAFLKKDLAQAGEIEKLSASGIDFVACENTMRNKNIPREALIDGCRTVPAGLVEIVMKQDQKWRYIKAGF